MNEYYNNDVELFKAALRQAIRQMKVLSANDEEIQTAMKEAIRQVEEEGFSGD